MQLRTTAGNFAATGAKVIDVVKSSMDGPMPDPHAIQKFNDAITSLLDTLNTMRDKWRKNPRNRYQPYMVYSRRPRYQPRYPN